MEGFTHLIPFAAGHEVISQRRRDLTLIRMTPDLIYDQLIGAGCARKLIFSWGGNPGVGSLHRFRDAVEHSWPVPLEIEEHSHAGMANRYVAGASGIPFAVLRGYNGTDLYRLETLSGASGSVPTIKPISCPFTGETLAAVSALRPDVAVIRPAGRPDRERPAVGITGVQKEARARVRPFRGHGGGDRRRATPARRGGAAQLDGDVRGPGRDGAHPSLRARLLRP
jgi:glutaconate CoA-transferase subunit A